MSSLVPVRKTINIPAELIPLIDTRIKEEEYHSLSAYFVALAIFDCYCRRKHRLTSDLMKMPIWKRDQIIGDLVKEFDTMDPTKRPGGWFDAKIKELIEKEGVNALLPPTADSKSGVSPKA